MNDNPDNMSILSQNVDKSQVNDEINAYLDIKQKKPFKFVSFPQMEFVRKSDFFFMQQCFPIHSQQIVCSCLCMFVFGFEVPPIDQKRMVAFINEFIISTVSFLNEFMTNIETKFVEFELKMQKIEASLMIVEAKVR